MTQESQFMKVYSVKEVSEKIDVPSGTIREWEKQLESVLTIPRDEHNNRYYTEFEIQTLTNIKVMREKKLGFPVIRDLLQQAKGETEHNLPVVPVTHKGVPNQSEALEAIPKMAKEIHQLREQNETLKEILEMMVTRQDTLEAIIRELNSTEKQIASGQSETFKNVQEEVSLVSEQLRTLSERVEVVNQFIQETKAEKHQKKSIWARMFKK